MGVTSRTYRWADPRPFVEALYPEAFRDVEDVPLGPVAREWADLAIAHGAKRLPRARPPLRGVFVREWPVAYCTGRERGQKATGMSTAEKAIEALGPVTREMAEAFSGLADWAEAHPGEAVEAGERAAMVRASEEGQVE